MNLVTDILLNNYDNTLKEIFGVYFKNNILFKLQLKNLYDNINFKEKQTDLLSICSIDRIDELIDLGYKQVEYEEYQDTFVNSVIEIKEIKNYKISNFKNNLILLGDEIISFEYEKNILNIFDKFHNLIKSIEFDFDINFFYITNDGFLYFLSDSNFIKTHIALDFYRSEKTHKCITSISEMEKLYSVDIENIKEIIYLNDYEIQFIGKDDLYYKATLGKKMFFLKDNKVFYNVMDFSKTSVVIQTEHLHLYDWISLLGLNKFTTENGLETEDNLKDYNFEGIKLSSFKMDLFKDIITFKFDNTLNGTLNYADFGNNKSYRINKEIQGIQITGNFNYKYEKGKYKIILKANKEPDNTEIKYTIMLLKNNICLKTVTGKTVDRIMYFCNLKFNFFYQYYDIFEEFEIDITDDYSVKIFSKVEPVDEKSNITDFNELFKYDNIFFGDSFKQQMIETDYDNGHFIIRKYIVDSNNRNDSNDLYMRFIEKDGTPSILWQQIKDKEYFLRLKQYSVAKIMKPRRKQKHCFVINKKNFSLKLKDIINR